MRKGKGHSVSETESKINRISVEKVMGVCREEVMGVCREELEEREGGNYLISWKRKFLRKVKFVR